MIFSYRKLLARLRFAVLFIVLTLALYQVMAMVSGWIQPANKYKPPAGRAEKVFQPHQHASLLESGTMSDRLRLFYWYGE